jgi:hypothetical protein
MGTSDASLSFGIDLGGYETDWKFKPNYGRYDFDSFEPENIAWPKAVTSYKWYAPEDLTDNILRYLKSKGLEGLEITAYCNCDYPGYLLNVEALSLHASEGGPADAAAHFALLNTLDIDAGRALLNNAIDALAEIGLLFAVRPEPTWLLTCCDD